MTVRRKHESPRHLVDGNDQVIEVGGHCGLFIDVAPETAAPAPGDWIATNGGSRYLVDAVRVVRRRRHAQQKRYQMTVLRLPKHTEPPADVHVIWLNWYPRAAHR